MRVRILRAETPYRFGDIVDIANDLEAEKLIHQGVAERLEPEKKVRRHVQPKRT